MVTWIRTVSEWLGRGAGGRAAQGGDRPPPPEFLYLAGDSYPDDVDAESALCARIPQLLRQPEWLGDTGGRIDRATRIERAARRAAPSGNAVLIGRSSGARAATEIAIRHKLRAVICLGYPFQGPGLVADVARFQHLNHLDSPTLILQGSVDEYGGTEITERYAFSSAVQIRLIEGVAHKLDLSPAGWDRVAEIILDFIAAAPARPEVVDFDEADYLHRHPDVAADVLAGRVASGKAHFVEHGRAAGRQYRLMPIDVDAAPAGGGEKESG